MDGHIEFPEGFDPNDLSNYRNVVIIPHYYVATVGVAEARKYLPPDVLLDALERLETAT